MESCIDGDGGRPRRARARTSCTMPLRFVVRPPAERAARLDARPPRRRAAAVLAQGDRRSRPGTRARGLDPHQGAVLLHDGETGELQRAPQRLGDHRDPHRRRLGGRDEAAGATRRARGRRSSARVSRARSHVDRDAGGLGDPELRIWSRTPAHAEALALESHALVCDSVEEALDGAEIVCTCTSSREPIVRRAWLAPGTHVNAVGSSIPTARELDADLVAAAALFVDRRESTRQRVGRLPARGRRSGHRARTTSAPSWASCSSGRPTDAVTTTSSRSSSRSGSPSRTSPPPRSASSGRASVASAPRSSSEPGGGTRCRPARGDRARARDHCGRRP